MNGDSGLALEQPRRRSRSVPDRVLGALGVGMMVLALVVLIRGGASDGEAALGAPPPLALLEPVSGSEVDGPLSVVFDLQAELVPRPSGWGAGAYHLHLQLDGLELMPGPADVVPLRSGGYRWTVGELEPGEHRLRLFWSDAQHRPVEGGESEVVEIEAR